MTPEQFEHRVNVAVTALMSIAALATSWASYQATIWNGNQLEYANEAFSLRTRATRASTSAGLLRAIDVGIFNSWLSAYAQQQTTLARFYEARFRPEFAVAFREWVASRPRYNPEAAPSPFTLASYRLQLDADAARLDHAADSVTALSSAANRYGDQFILDAVLFAAVIAFAGAAQQQTKQHVRLLLLGLATAMCVVGLGRLAVSPGG